MRPQIQRQDSQGFVLIAVLWIGGAIGLIALAMTALARADVVTLGDLTGRMQARAAAEGALYLGIHAFLSAQEGSLPGAMQDTTVGDISVVLSWEDESAKVDLNAAPLDLLQAVFQRAGLDADDAEALAAKAADWRDEDSVKRPGGAEAVDYEREGASAPGNRPFMTAREVEQVLGFPKTLSSALAGALTVYSGLAQPELLHASALVRDAVHRAPAETEEADAPGPPSIVTLHAEANRPVRYTLAAVIRFLPDAARPYHIVQMFEAQNPPRVSPPRRNAGASVRPPR